MSALLQTRGFSNIDALDADLDSLNRLRIHRLYRNYIWCCVYGDFSTGLRQDTYDLVITAGGLAIEDINLLDLTEMLRILRPGGHLLWTKKDEKTPTFMSFDANLRGLERAGRIKVELDD